MNKTERVALNTVGLDREQAAGRAEIQILPEGHVQSQNGDLLVDTESIRSILDRFDRDRQAGKETVIDYEHQSLGPEYMAGGGPVPAAGWIIALRHVPGRGIIATVEWTDKARETIRTREYRYCSPVVQLEKATRRVLWLDSVGLTNRPAIAGMERLAARERTGAATTGATLMDELKKLLELPPEADEQAILKAVQALKALAEKADGGEEVTEEATEANKRVARLLDLDASAGADALVVAVNKLRERATANEAAAEELVAMRAQLQRVEEDRAIEKAIANNLIHPKNEEDVTMCRTRYRENPEVFELLMAERRKYCPPPGRITPVETSVSRGGTTSAAVAREAFKSWHGMPALHGVFADVREYVNARLDVDGLAPLSDGQFASLQEAHRRRG
jgi:phage I-like protein